MKNQECIICGDEVINNLQKQQGKRALVQCFLDFSAPRFPSLRAAVLGPDEEDDPNHHGDDQRRYGHEH